MFPISVLCSSKKATRNCFWITSWTKSCANVKSSSKLGTRWSTSRLSRGKNDDINYCADLVIWEHSCTNSENMYQHYSEVQVLKEENKRLKRQIKEQAVAASVHAMPSPQLFEDKYQDPKKQDQDVGPPDHTRPMFNKPRKNSVQLPIVVSAPEKSYSGSHPEQPHVQTRYRHQHDWITWMCQVEKKAIRSLTERFCLQ